MSLLYPMFDVGTFFPKLVSLKGNYDLKAFPCQLSVGDLTI